MRGIMRLILFLLIILIFHKLNAQTFSEGYTLYKQKNFTEAAEIFKKLSDEGNSKAQTRLGFMYYKGLGVKKDFENAVKYYKLAIENNENDRAALTNLGWMYQRGWGVNKNLKLSSELYLKAAEMNYAAAQNKIAESFEFGRGVKKNYEKAIYWYEQASKNGYRKAKQRVLRVKEKMNN